MGRGLIKRGLYCTALALLCLEVLPSIAAAETHTFLNTDHLAPSDGAGTYGPASQHYPSRIQVTGLSGTVNKATVTLVDFSSSSPDDLDLVITGPNGQKVMLMSDACGEYPTNLTDATFVFDDSAQSFIPNSGPCGDGLVDTYKPSNYLGNQLEPDDLSITGGPAPDYVNALSFFNGSSPNGDWDLYALDDNSAGYLGFNIIGWTLTLDTQPTPEAVPAKAKKCRKKKRVSGAAAKRCKKKKKRV